MLSKEEAKAEREFQGLYVRSESGLGAEAAGSGGLRSRTGRGDREDHAGRRLTTGGESSRRRLFTPRRRA